MSEMSSVQLEQLLFLAMYVPPTNACFAYDLRLATCDEIGLSITTIQVYIIMTLITHLNNFTDMLLTCYILSLPDKQI